MDIRHKILFAAIAIPAAAVVLRMVYLAGAGGDVYRAEAARTAESRGELSAIRGRIYEADGRLAAWSVRRYDLIWTPRANTDAARNAAVAQALRNAFADAFPPAAPPPVPGSVLKYDLTMHELELADALNAHYPELETVLRWERVHDGDSTRLGEVRQEDGTEFGISGLEAQFDARLRGTPGIYTVMLDREGRWIDTTFRIQVPPRPGEDIHLSEPDGEP